MIVTEKSSHDKRTYSTSIQLFHLPQYLQLHKLDSFKHQFIAQDSATRPPGYRMRQDKGIVLRIEPCFMKSFVKAL